MPERPQLVLSPLIKREPLLYKCSACDQAFILPEDRAPKEGMVELMAAFAQHISEVHPAEASGDAGRQWDRKV